MDKYNVVNNNRYVVEKGLYIQQQDGDSSHICKRRVIVKEKDKQKILSMRHSGIDGMHFGRDKTYGKASNCSCIHLLYIQSVIIFNVAVL